MAENLLQNPGMEGDYYQFDGVGELTIAPRWRPWFVQEPGVHRPEFKAETVGVGSGRVHSGDKAQKQFTTFARHQGGIYQVVQVTPGEWYTFSAWAYVWSSSEDNPDESVRDGKYSALVGINPWGDERATYRTTVWGKEALNVYNQWVRVSVTAEAWSDNIVVFTHGACEYGVKHSDSYWDDCVLTLADMGGGTEPPPPPPPPGDVDYARIKADVADVLAEWDRR